MERFILPNDDPKTRLRYLQDSCDGVEEKKYYKKLSEIEMQQKRIQFTNNALKLDDLDQEKKEFVEKIKQQAEPLKSIHKTLSHEVRTGFAEFEGKLFKFVDHETRMVYYYSEDGELIDRETRPANTEELQQLTLAYSRRAVNE